jgi:endonuclease/exonuclease/phosphatase family metal-dependent hydrolase
VESGVTVVSLDDAGYRAAYAVGGRQPWRRSYRPNVPFQNDYLFVSPKLFSALVTCAVLATDEWFAISDHAPIVAVFESAA